MANVVFEHVTKQFGSVTAVNDLSIEIRDKEFLVLVGPSGCGKTTALRMIAGLEEVTAGEIYIGGRPVTNVSPKDRDIAMVFQSYALYPHMNVFDNMAFGLKMRKISKGEIDRRVKEAAGSIGIEALLERKPRQLSGGQRQRVALGRAIVREPAVFLMDEPLSNLDAKLRVATRAELIKLHQRLQTTIVYVTHDQVEAMTMGSRIAVMKDGLLQQLDTPQMLYNHPVNTFVAGFIGSPAMNFFDVGVETCDGQAVLMGPAGCRVMLQGEKAQQALPFSGKALQMGVRPEHFDVKPTRANGASASMPCGVEVVEQMGSEQHLYLNAGGAPFVAKLEATVPARIGDAMTLYFDPDALHLFDPETQRSVLS